MKTMDRMAFIIILSSTSLAITASSGNYSNNSQSSPPSRIGHQRFRCPINSKAPVSIFLNLRGDWLGNFSAHNKTEDFTKSISLDLEKQVLECGDSEFMAITGYLKDTDSDSLAEDSSGGRSNRKRTNGDSNGCCERTRKQLNRETRKALEVIEHRMNSFEKTLANIEGMLDEMRGFLNPKKDLDVKDEQNSTAKPSPSPRNTTNGMSRMKFDAEHKGRKVELSSDLRTAKRTKPLENSGHYGGVVSEDRLKEDQVFEIRIEETMDQWSDQGIAIGAMIIKEEKQKRNKNLKNQAEMVEGAWSLFYNIKGTWAIRSASYSIPGKSNTYKDTYYVTQNTYPLDTRRLPVGTLLGISRRKNGDLHFYLNGVDKGPAFKGLPKDVHAFVDVMNYVTKISIAS